MEKRSSEIEIFAVSKDGKPISDGTGLKTRVEKKTDEVIREEEVVVRIDGETHKFHCIPTELEEMILGNLKSRGIDPSFSHIRKIVDNEFDVDIGTSERIKELQKCESDKKLTSEEVFNAVECLAKNSFLFRKTGCTHVIGICGDREIFAEDTSRHCATDKAIGLAIKAGTDFSRSFLVTSCRQTASIIKKAIFCRIPIVISIAAPTLLAVKEANEYRITLIGFADSKRFNVYSHGWRIEI